MLQHDVALSLGQYTKILIKCENNEVVRLSCGQNAFEILQMELYNRNLADLAKDRLYNELLSLLEQDLDRNTDEMDTQRKRVYANCAMSFGCWMVTMMFYRSSLTMFLIGSLVFKAQFVFRNTNIVRDLSQSVMFFDPTLSHCLIFCMLHFKAGVNDENWKEIYNS